MHPVHTFPSYFLNSHCNIIFPSTPRSSEIVSSLDVIQNFLRISHLTYAFYMPRPYKPPSSSLCSLLHPPAISSLLDPNILLSALFSNTSVPGYEGQTLQQRAGCFRYPTGRGVGTGETIPSVKKGEPMMHVISLLNWTTELVFFVHRAWTVLPPST